MLYFEDDTIQHAGHAYYRLDVTHIGLNSERGAAGPWGAFLLEREVAGVTCACALVRRDVKALVVACNTSTSVALTDFRRRYDLPVLGVVRPGAAAAALATRNRRVGVIATPATVRSRAYFNAIKDENPAIEVYEHATPTLVPLVESGQLSGLAVETAPISAP